MMQFVAIGFFRWRTRTGSLEKIICGGGMLDLENCRLSDLLPCCLIFSYLHSRPSLLVLFLHFSFHAGRHSTQGIARYLSRQRYCRRSGFRYRDGNSLMSQSAHQIDASPSCASRVFNSRHQAPVLFMYSVCPTHDAVTPLLP